MPPRRSIADNTIAGHIASHYKMWAWCVNCHHSAQLDLQALGERLGFDHGTLHHEITPKLVCSQCGERDRLQIRIVAGAKWPPD